MANVVILKQPLYGTITWNGYDFDYVPNQGFSSNDVYIYSKSVNGSNNVFTQYISPANTPPVSKTVAVTADAFNTKEFSIDDIVTDITLPFGNLKIISVEGAKYGIVSTDGSKIYYKSDSFNNIEHLTYTVSDKQFTTSGTITLSVVNGYNHPAVTINPLIRMYDFRNRLTSYMALSTYWTGASYIIHTYGPVWDSVDTGRYNNFCDAVLYGFHEWNLVYDSTPRYDSKNTTLCGFSAIWDDNTVVFYTYNNELYYHYNKWITEYAELTANAEKWNNNITDFDKLTSSIDSNQENYNQSYVTTQAYYDNIWDTTELNSFTATNTNTYNQVFSNISQNKIKWETPITKYQEISSNIYSLSGNIYDAYNTIQQNSAINWDSTELNNISADNFDKWNNYYNLLTSRNADWNSIITRFSGISADIKQSENYIYLINNLIQSNSGTIWNNQSITSITSGSSANWDNAYNLVLSNSGYWNTTSDLSSIIDLDKFYYDETYSVVSSNSAIKWNYSDINIIFSDNSYNWNNLYVKLTASSGYWNATNDLSGVIENDQVYYNQTTSIVASNSAVNWDTYELTSYLSSASGNWDSLYANLTANSGYWSTSDSLSGVISNDKIIFDSASSVVASNSAVNWDTYELTSYLSSNSGNWDGVYGSLSNSNDWTIISSISSMILDKNATIVSTYNTICANSGLNWNVGVLYSNTSAGIAKYNNAKNLIFNTDSNSIWLSVDDIYNKVNSPYTQYYSLLESTRNTVNTTYIYWDTTALVSLLSTSSGYWASLKNTLSDTSSYWTFNETQNLKNSYNVISSNSAKWNNEYTILVSNSGKWNDNINQTLIATSSSQYLTGSPSISLSSKDITIYGDLIVSQNVSAFGPSTKINTSNYTVSSISISNTGTSDAFKITKTSGLNNIATFSANNPVMWIKTNNTVSINLTGGTETLNLIGNLSASGNVYPYLSDITSLYKSNSAKYESGYTFFSINSSDLNNTNNSASSYYDQFVNYVQLSTNTINTLTGSVNNTNTIFGILSVQYNKNTETNNSVSAFGSLSGIDSEYRNNISKYNTTYNILTTAQAIAPITISQLFTFAPSIVSAQKIRMVIADDISIDSYTIIADTNSDITVDILSGFTLANYKESSITNNNYIRLSATGPSKNTQNNLSSFGWLTYIKKGTILQFNLTQNTAASAILINLKAYKQQII